MDTTHRVTRHELYELAWSRPLSSLAAELGISGNALARICDRLLVPHPKRGYWSTGGEARHGDRPPLPPPPPDCEDVIEISSRPARSRRGRTRLSLEARRLQIADAAVELVLDHGPNAVTMKAVAQAAGVSEALVYRYFSSVIELLVFLARREQVLMASIQAARTQSHEGYSDRAEASVVGFLDYVAERRGLLQRLLGNGEVRRALRDEHQGRLELAAQVVAELIHQQSGVSPEIGTPGWRILRAAATRTGKLLASGKIDRATAGRLSGASMNGARARMMAFRPGPSS